MTNTCITKLLALALAMTTWVIASAQDQKVTIKMADVALSEVLKSIETQTEYRFSYRNAVIDSTPTVSADFKDTPVKAVLDNLLPDLGLEYKVEAKNTISIIKRKPTPSAPLVTIGVDVTDDFLEMPLPDAKVEVLTPDSVKIQDLKIIKFLQGSTGKVAAAHAYADLPIGQKYIFHGAFDGYEDAWLDVDVAPDAYGKVWGGSLKLEKIFKKDLNDVVVTATKVKMFWKGDTIVYDASAFNLPEGSMLDDLIRQMPGVTMNDAGEIFVNGRKVDELLLGSRSFFRGKSEVLLKNLPYYTVKNIKVYEKSSDLSEAAGYDVEPKQYVMDVNLLEKYNRGIIANVEAAGGTSERYLWRAFMLGFTDIFRFSVVGNANNVNETRHIGQNSQWHPDKTPKSRLTTRSVASDLDFNNKKIENKLNIDYTWTSNSVAMTQRRETFMEGARPLSALQSNSIDKNRSLKIYNYFKLPRPWTIVLLDYTHRTFSSRSSSATRQYDSDALTNSISDFGWGDGSEWKLINRFYQNYFFNKARRTRFDYDLTYTYNKEESHNYKKYEFLIPQADPLRNVNEYYNRYNWLIFNASFSTRISRDIELSINQYASFERTRRHDYLYHPDTLMLPSQRDALLAITDLSNSYDSRHSSDIYGTTLKLCQWGLLSPNALMPIPYDYRKWYAGIKFIPRSQSLYYHRGSIDSHVTSKEFVLGPWAEVHIYPTNSYARQIDLSADHNISAPSLYDRIDYRDDSQPLIVKLGNPDLKGDQTSTFKAAYYARGLNEQLFHVGAEFKYMHRATAQSVEYSPQTGIYTYRPVNVHGNWNASAKVDFTRSLGEKKLWTINNTTDGSFIHSLDHTMLQGQSHSTLNKVNTLTLHDGMYVQYAKGSLNVRATADARWRHSTGKMRDFATLNAVDFQYGLSARYTIPVLNATVSADGTMYSRRGYGSASLNTNDFILNASISRPFMKGKLVTRIECFDMLHQLSQTQYEVNAQGRVETWFRSLPHYAMLHVVYQFSISPIQK